MDVSNWLKDSTEKLGAAGIGTARLDALVLLEDVTGLDRAWLLANVDHKISPGDQTKLTKLLNQRKNHTPLAYIRGRTEFYGRNFVVTPAVLEPRPESETMIDILKKLVHSGNLAPESGSALRIADVGAGSGALGITAKLELEGSIKTAVDLLEIDPKALKIAQLNVDKHTTSIGVVESDLLNMPPRSYNVLLCNLPYVPDEHTVNEAASREPGLAIFGGSDGLDIYRSLFKQLEALSERPLYILTESLPPQHEALASIAKSGGYDLERTSDFIQVFREQQESGQKR